MRRTAPVRANRAQRRAVLRLYVAGFSRNSVAAQNNLHAVTADLPDAALDIEIVDVFKFPQRALADGVLVTPTLIRLSPRPVQIIIGDLSDRDALRAALGPLSTHTRATS